MKITMLGTGNALVTECYGKNHSTVKDACEIAAKLHVKNLLLYHTEDKNILNRKKLYLAEGEKFFSGKIFIPDDLEILTL